MPPKVFSHLLKPRNLRVIVIILAFATLIISLFFLYNFFDNSEPVPTPYSHLNNDIDEDEDSHEERKYSIDGLSADFRKASRNRTRGRGRGRKKSPPNLLSRPPNPFNGKCEAIPSFTPDIDVNKIYPTLPFDQNWVHAGEYWNTFFEERYRTTKKSSETPYMKVFVIPHSHTDPGWLRTFEDYFHLQTQHIIDNAVDKLEEFPLMRFQLSEISFLAKWWQFAHPTRRANLQKLVKEGRLEIATGGWVMTDEATVHLYSMIDQLIEGHQWVKSHLGVVPKTSWSIDPFGHTSTFPYVLKASGIDNMIIQRIHYGWKKWFAEQQCGDFNWVQRWDTENKNKILCHNAPFDIYSIKHSCGPHPQICLGFDFRNVSGEYTENYGIMEQITRQNVKEKAEVLLEQYGRTASLFPHNVAMISLGDDFRYSHAIEWNQQYLNYMTLFNYINSNKDKYRAEVNFGTISEYFKAIQERSTSFPSLSGDFFVYSDIFSEGRPAYWSGYYGTRPFWKKLYRETENALRNAEILFSYANALARQSQKYRLMQVMSQEFDKLVTGRRWLGLFAHHDATTGTSKVATMNDYGVKLLEASQISSQIQIISINSILFGRGDQSHVSTDFEQSSFGDLPKKIPIRLNTTKQEKKIILFNNLGWRRSHLAKVVVRTPNVKVVGPNGRHVLSQLNPIVDLTNRAPELSSNMFELTFLADLPALSLVTYSIRMIQPNEEGAAALATIYCKDCVGTIDNLFQINGFQPGNIQLTSDRMQLLFDRNTGFLLGIKKLKENTFVNTKLSFGSYTSIDHKSGAYLLKVDTRSQPNPIPFFASGDPRIFIISGPISSELSVSHAPLLVSTTVMHTGGSELEEAVFIQNTVNLGEQRGEVYLRFDTDLDTTIPNPNPVSNDPQPEPRLPVFYTDQNGYTMEKRIKVKSINLEGNYYPVTTQSYIQDEARGLRFSVLVDRAHGFSSFEKGRLETLIERRTVYDDARGMGEGVTDNRETVSNYVLTLESLPLRQTADSTKLDHSVPSLMVHHLSQQLNYPAPLFVVDYDNFPQRSSSGIYPLFNQELPCDTHLINFRTLALDKVYATDLNMPAEKALIVVQRFGYFCTLPSNQPGCGRGNNKRQNLFHSGTALDSVHVSSYTQTDLTAVNSDSFRNLSALHDLHADPFEIKSVILNF